MALRDFIAGVLALQPQYTSANSDAMRQRGILIRSDIPAASATIAMGLSEAMRVPTSDLIIEGRDGTGLKSEIPWVRFASRESSPSATTGWYVVLLFKRDGSGVYLCLCHGSTQFVNGALVARADHELQQLMRWARGRLGADFALDARLVSAISLASTAPLALAYEKSCVSSYYYPAETLPPDGAMRSDLLTMARFLGDLYEAERLGQTPLSTSPEVRDAVEAAEGIAKPGKPGQGFSLSSVERRAVEHHAMVMATLYMRDLGYEVKDVCLTQSYDLEATRDQETLKVEVKGTTGGLNCILLTSNEVELHKASHPCNALVVVHSIVLIKGTPPTTSGGTLHAWHPWKIDEARLRPISYVYEL